MDKLLFLVLVDACPSSTPGKKGQALLGRIQTRTAAEDACFLAIEMRQMLYSGKEQFNGL